MTSTRIPGLLRLPYELISCIVADLDVQDVFNWSLCSRNFQYMVREDSFCKPVVMAKVPGSLEAKEALKTGRFSRALRRLVKRRTALAQASPYIVSNIACADSYGFFGGTLCYIIEARPQRWLRILDTRSSTDWELVVDIPKLIRSAFRETQAARSRKFKFRVLYYAVGIVSCLFSFASPRTENWLLIFQPQENRILGILHLESTSRIFVRNNAKFLYFGTHSWEDADGLRKWVIRGFDLTNEAWLPHPRMYLSSLAGCDIGSTVCFEIFGDYFYAVSNQSLFEADDPEWMSHYYCFRFPLHEPSHEKSQVMEKGDSWRRKHSEGPIDDRWGFLSLELDEASTNIVILECRKEWLRDRSGSQRTYYTTEVIFRQQKTNEGGQQQQQEQIVDNVTAERMGDHPHCDASIPVRWPEYVHAGDDSTTASLLVRSKTYFCAYVRCCHTFIDLIDDACIDIPSPQRLRIRTGYRRLKPGVELPIRNHSAPNASQMVHLKAPTDQSEQGQQQLYQPNTIFVWPPHSQPDPDPCLDTVQQLVNVEGHQGCVTAAGDERSLIYATSNGPKGLKVLVFLSFDPATRLEGAEYGGKVLGERLSRDVDQIENETCGEMSRSDSTNSSTGDPSLGAMDGIRCETSSTGHFPPSTLAAPEGDLPWASYERAMHLDLRRGLYFAKSAGSDNSESEREVA